MDFLMDTLNRVPNVVFKSGNGATLRDQHDRDWLDFFADVGTASLGYCSAHAEMALNLMVHERIPVHAPNLYNFGERSMAAERLCKMTGMERVFFSNSGAEGVEAALKMARLKAWHNGETRTLIVGIQGAFHGRTLATLAAGDGPPYHTEGQGPLPEGFLSLPAEALPGAIPPNAAGVVLAPVFGNNDVREYSMRWHQDLAEYCASAGIALIYDEVQTGAGRSGDVTYAKRLGIKPDIMMLAKGIAMGAPVAATLANGPYAHAITPGRHFSTFGGNPFSAAMVNGMIDWLNRPGNLLEANSVGERLRGGLRAMGCKNVRGPGMLVAFDHDGDCLELAERCRKHRLLIGAFREGPGPVKITPPLNITMHELEDGMQRLAKALRA